MSTTTKNYVWTKFPTRFTMNDGKIIDGFRIQQSGYPNSHPMDSKNHEINEVILSEVRTSNFPTYYFGDMWGNPIVGGKVAVF